jgi:hypothetical protein
MTLGMLAGMQLGRVEDARVWLGRAPFAPAR